MEADKLLAVMDKCQSGIVNDDVKYKNAMCEVISIYKTKQPDVYFIYLFIYIYLFILLSS